jgi:hypothetical protein
MGVVPAATVNGHREHVSHSPHINPLGVPLLDVGRDVNGRFRKGNQGGPGNPFARKVAALRKTLLDSVSEQDLKEMIEILKQQARQGDKTAIKLILQYCVGKPEPPKDPDRMDVDEWQRLRQMRVGEQEFNKTTETIPACLACHQAATVWPCNVQEGPLAQTIHDLHADLQATDQGATAPGKPSKNTPDGARPKTAPVQPSAAAASQTGQPNAQSEPAAPTAQRPSSAKGERKSNDRRVPAGRSGRDSHSPTQPPSPNGENEQEQPQAPEHQQRPRQPSEPSGQTQRKPPRR